MQNGQGITANQLGIALAFGSIAFGSIPPGLEAVGHPLGPAGGYVLLGLAALCGAGAMIAFWPLTRVVWSWFKRIRIRNPFTLLSTDTDSFSVVKRETGKEWEELPLIPVDDATFHDQPIPLDGYAYDRCTFVRCTFVYKGEKPFALRNFVLKDDWDVGAGAPQLLYFSSLLTALKFISKDIEVADEIKPDEPIAYGEVPRLAKPGYWENRQMLHAALKDFYAKSFDLVSEDVYEDDEVAEWESRATQLIAESLGRKAADTFLTDDGGLSHAPADATPRQLWIGRRQAQLSILVRVVDSLSRLEIHPDFDGRKWVGSEQFRFEQGTAF